MSWLAVAVSTLLLGLLFAFVAPRALERAAEAGRTAPWASTGWGLVLALGGPVVAVVAVALVLGIPLGIGLLLSIVLLSCWASWSPRRPWDACSSIEDRRTTTAFLAGWAHRDRARRHPVRERRGLRRVGDLRTGCRDGRRSGGREARAARHGRRGSIERGRQRFRWSPTGSREAPGSLGVSLPGRGLSAAPERPTRP